MLHVHIFYEVEHGDTVSDIARRFNVDVPTLTHLNAGWLTKDLDIIYVRDLVRIQ